MEGKDIMKRKIYSEKLLEKKLTEGIELLGGLSYKFSSSNSKGNPDRLLILPGGNVFFAEIKTTGKKPSPTQLLKKGEIESRGIKVFIIDDYVSLLACFNYVTLLLRLLDIHCDDIWYLFINKIVNEIEKNG